MRHRIGLLATIVMGFACSWAAHGDGLFVTEWKYANRPPGIPAQRAFIGYRDGTERLVVESTVDAKGAALAWILPVPATPTSLSEASPGFLKTLSLNVGAVVSDDAPAGALRVMTLLAFALLVWALFLLAVRPRFRYALASLIGCIILMVWLGPDLSRGTKGVETAEAGSGEPTVNVRVLQAGVVGNYEVAVLEALDAAALETWLAENGFAALPQGGRTIADRYIAEGWRFVASKLRPDKEGLVRPHPLEIVFPAKQPVYPMRLTALAESAVYVELYVAASGAVENPLLKTQLSEIVSIADSDAGLAESAYLPISGASLGHPDFREYLWGGCRLTRLDGTLSPGQMSEDLVLASVEKKPFQERYYTVKALRFRRWSLALAIWALVLTPVALAATLLKNRAHRAIGLAGALAVALAAAGTTAYVKKDAGPVAEAAGVESYPEAAPAFGPGSYDIGKIIEGIGLVDDGFERLDRVQAEALIRAYLAYTPVQNDFTGEPILFEDSPGNLTLGTEDGFLTYTRYNQDGSPRHSRVLGPNSPLTSYGGKQLGNSLQYATEDLLQEMHAVMGANRSDAAALAIRGHEEGFRWLEEHDRYLEGDVRRALLSSGNSRAVEFFLRRWQEHSDAFYNEAGDVYLIYSVARSPKRMGTRVLELLKDKPDGQSPLPPLAYAAVRALAIATHTPAPSDPLNQSQLTEFVKEVQAKLAAMPDEES